jgi:hypothetical protein
MKNRPKPRIRPVDYHLECCIEARFRKIASTGRKSARKHPICWECLGPSKARIACHVQHVEKGSPDSKYDLSIESLLASKRSTTIVEIATIRPSFCSPSVLSSNSGSIASGRLSLSPIFVKVFLTREFLKSPEHFWVGGHYSWEPPWNRGYMETMGGGVYS